MVILILYSNENIYELFSQYEMGGANSGYKTDSQEIDVITLASSFRCVNSN